MRKALSVKAIEAFKPKVKRYEVHDILCPGFSLRVFPTGRKVFSVKYRYGLTQRRLPIGVHPRISLAEARNKAIEALRLVDEGIDPAARRRQLSMTFESVCADFIRQYARPRNRSWREAERIMDREFVSVFGQRDIREIKRHDIIELMDGAMDWGHPIRLTAFTPTCASFSTGAWSAASSKHRPLPGPSRPLASSPATGC